MGTSLTGLTPSTTYDALIKVGDNGPITSTLKTLSDGLGNDLPMEASTTTINFTNGLQQGGVAVPTASQVNAKQDTLVSGTNIKTVNSTSLLGSGNVAVQDVLVSGTNIKTINGTSVLGSGNIVTPTTNPSGVAGAIQFSNGSAFASDAANLFWDDTNNRLGIGTNVPNTNLEVYSGAGGYISHNASSGYNGFSGFRCNVSGGVRGYMELNPNTGEFKVGADGSGYFLTLGAGGVERMRVTTGGTIVKGSGSTSATTSLLVQNSSAFTSLKTLDNGEVLMYPSSTYPSDTSLRSYQSGGLAVVGLISDRLTVTGGGANDTYIQGYGIYLHYERFRGLVINNISSATQSTTPSALVEMQSTTQGFLPPKMTTTQKNAIATPAAGLVVYDSTTNKLCCYNGSTWNDLF